jgi:hypothetical protein
MVRDITKSGNWPHVQFWSLLLTVYPFISHLNEDIASHYFQQDGDSTVRVSFALQRVHFGEQMTQVDIWPPISPYLSAEE